MRLALLLTIAVTALNLSSLAQPGSLDGTFGSGGKVVTDFGIDEVSSCLAIQQDGKIILAGSQANNVIATGDYDNFLLIRYNTNGSIDSSFGKKGKITTDFRNRDDWAYAITIDINNKIFVAGATLNPLNNTESDFALAKYNSNGHIDSNFGINGKVVTDFRNRNDMAKSVVVKSDGKILVAGTSESVDASESDFVIVQYNTDGSIDSTFGLNGKTKPVFSNQKATGNALALEADKIIIGGTVSNLAGTTHAFALAKFNKDGILDSSFGVNGISTSASDPENNSGNALGLQDDKIIIAGSTNIDFSLMRFNNDGIIDSTFGTNGKVKTDYSNFENFGKALIISADKKITVAGTVYDTNGPSLMLARYNTDGTIDNGFGTNGIVTTTIGNGGSALYGMALQPDENIVVTGDYVGAGALDYDIFVVRYIGGTVLPISLSAFTATKKQNSVLLNWQTATESNNAYFAIERSNNCNSNFKEIGRVSSKGNSTQLQQYSFEDMLPLNGENYYRLKQVDKDGHTTYSKIVFIDFSAIAKTRLYPNPVKDILTVDGLTGNKTTISIIDVNGRTLATTSTNDATYTWNVKSLPAGTYYLRTEADKKISTNKFIKE